MLRAIKKLTWITALLTASCILLLSQCVDRHAPNDTGGSDTLPEAFAGAASCAGCHKNIYESHLNTAHYRTTRPTEERYLMGSFHPDSNRFHFNRSVYVAMEKRDSGWYQVEYFRDEEKKRRRMDIIVGSGAMGQSFLNWRGDGLFQLPITYFSAAHAWSNSPGFPDRVVFNQTITSRCMECHATFAEVMIPYH